MPAIPGTPLALAEQDGNGAIKLKAARTAVNERVEST
jgi:hypothetical protein